MVARKYSNSYDAKQAVREGKVDVAFVCWADPIYDDGEEGLEFIGEDPWALISGKAACMRLLFPESRRHSWSREYTEGRPWTLDEVKAFLGLNGCELAEAREPAAESRL